MFKIIILKIISNFFGVNLYSFLSHSSDLCYYNFILNTTWREGLNFRPNPLCQKTKKTYKLELLKLRKRIFLSGKDYLDLLYVKILSVEEPSRNKSEIYINR